MVGIARRGRSRGFWQMARALADTVAAAAAGQATLASRRLRGRVWRLAAGVHYADVALTAVGEDRSVGRHERHAEVSRRGDDEAVGGIAAKLSRQAHACHGDGGVDGDQAQSGLTESFVEPSGNVAPQPEAALFRQPGNFPRRDRREADAPGARGFVDLIARGRSQSPVAVHDPHEHMGVEDDQRSAVQSAGSAAGSHGSS